MVATLGIALASFHAYGYDALEGQLLINSALNMGLIGLVGLLRYRFTLALASFLTGTFWFGAVGTTVAEMSRYGWNERTLALLFQLIGTTVVVGTAWWLWYQRFTWRRRQ